MTNRRRAGLVVGSIFIAALGVASRANAQSFVLDRFQPAPAGDRFFGVQGGDPGGHLSPRLMLLGDYAYKPLVMYQGSDETEVGAVVANQLFLHVAAGISLWDRLWVSANMPIALYTAGDNPGGFGSPSGAALGDLRAGVRVRLLGENRSLASLALSGYVFIPTGDEQKAAGAEEIHGMPALVLSGETDSIAYAVNAGMDMGKRTDGTEKKFRGDITFGGAFGFLLLEKMLQIGPEVYGSTAMNGTNSFAQETTSLEAIVGARLRVGPMVFGLGAGPGITRGVGTPTLRGLASVAYAPLPPKPAPPPPPPVKPLPPPDRDKDGVYDKDDACPDEPGIRSSDPEKNGCPPPPPDRDGDGILDKDDACPDLRGVRSDDPTQNGCPPDTDGDGIRGRTAVQGRCG
jgi:hypothetical protein